MAFAASFRLSRHSASVFHCLGCNPLAQVQWLWCPLKASQLVASFSKVMSNDMRKFILLRRGDDWSSEGRRRLSTENALSWIRHCFGGGGKFWSSYDLFLASCTRFTQRMRHCYCNTCDARSGRMFNLLNILTNVEIIPTRTEVGILVVIFMVWNHLCMS